MAVNSNPQTIALIEISSFGFFKDTLTQRSIRNELDALKNDLTQTVNEHKGTVIQHTGDTVHTSFATSDAALNAVCEILKNSVVAGEKVKPGFMISVGIAYGIVKVENGFMQSDAIETASSLLDKSNAGEILVATALYQALPDKQAYQFEKITRIENVQCWKLSCEGLADYNPMKIIGQAAGTENNSPDSTGPLKNTEVNLRYQGQEFSIKAGVARFTIGRAHDNDLVIPGAQVSRYHARVERLEEGITLINLSGIGCCFQPNESVAHECYSSQVLSGKGRIGLAENFHLSGENIIEYQVGSSTD